MKQIKHIYLFITLAIAAVLASCSKDDPAPGPGGSSETRAGVYVLNQGNFNQNNSTLTYYDYNSQATTADRYLTANATKIGDTGNDVGIYGAKMYIVVNNSGKLTIASAKTAKLIKQIDIDQPRYVVFYGKNAFVDSYNGTVAVVDTATLTITKTITVGRSPEQMVVSNNKLYVANSGGLDYPNFDNSVSVIDLATLTESKKVIVIENPISLAADRYNNVYVLSQGNYGNVSSGITIINALTDEVRSKTDVQFGYNIPVLAQGDYVYYPTADNKIAMFNARTQSPERANFITDGTAIASPYALAFDTTNGVLVIADAKDYSSNGTAYFYNTLGQRQQLTITTGINPGKITFVNK